MDTKPNQREISEEDMDHIFAAVEEIEKTGKTGRRCPWCGGELEFYIATNGFEVKCANDPEFHIMFRGI